MILDFYIQIFEASNLFQCEQRDRDLTLCFPNGKTSELSIISPLI